MKRRDLEKRLREIAAQRAGDFVLVRHGGSHDVYAVAGTRVIIPRHAEINDRLAQSIISQAEKGGS